jgi:hypothetical protein
MANQSVRVFLITFAAFFAFYFPSSVGGVISRALTAVSLISTCGLLGLLLLGRGNTPGSFLLPIACGLVAVPAGCTVISPFYEFSPGVVFIYCAIALLYLVNLKPVGRSTSIETAGLVLSAVSLLLGLAIIARVHVVTQTLKSYYAAFYPELVGNMIDLLGRPVLTFATHSMAGFMVYLLFFMAIAAHEARGQHRFLFLAGGHLMLLLFLQSTTSLTFAVVAALQFVRAFSRVFPRITASAALAMVVLAVAAWLGSNLTVADLFAAVQSAIVGDKIRGLFARYATEGLLAGSVTYFSEHPLSPIGFSFSESLYLGDSGVVVHVLRGSLPLLVAVYGGLFLFLRYNLYSRSIAYWLWLIIIMFETGFTPLMYFRFVAFVPFLIAYLNSVDLDTPRPLNEPCGLSS